MRVSPSPLSRIESDLDFKPFDVGNAGRCVSPRHLAVDDGDATVTNRIRQLIREGSGRRRDLKEGAGAGRLVGQRWYRST
ncbi:hypothetical protein QFZ67_006816 [Streptomyces sp. V1I1]|nr:hypothetical protein [Streptomyces sp. V1I1]